ncbi:MAG: hypothetical protein INQ03_11420 [Candidatus Heimdallarchaeota archaeon]|nr:hypothetical protein [Candidatus Heimdallarchaeota archaeon]
MKKKSEDFMDFTHIQNFEVLNTLLNSLNEEFDLDRSFTRYRNYSPELLEVAIELGLTDQEDATRALYLTDFVLTQAEIDAEDSLRRESIIKSFIMGKEYGIAGENMLKIFYLSSKVAQSMRRNDAFLSGRGLDRNTSMVIIKDLLIIPYLEICKVLLGDVSPSFQLGVLASAVKQSLPTDEIMEYKNIKAKENILPFAWNIMKAFDRKFPAEINPTLSISNIDNSSTILVNKVEKINLGLTNVNKNPDCQEIEVISNLIDFLEGLEEDKNVMYVAGELINQYENIFLVRNPNVKGHPLTIIKTQADEINVSAVLSLLELRSYEEEAWFEDNQKVRTCIGITGIPKTVEMEVEEPVEFEVEDERDVEIEVEEDVEVFDEIEEEVDEMEIQEKEVEEEVEIIDKIEETVEKEIMVDEEEIVEVIDKIEYEEEEEVEVEVEKEVSFQEEEEYEEEIMEDIEYEEEEEFEIVVDKEVESGKKGFLGIGKKKAVIKKVPEIQTRLVKKTKKVPKKIKKKKMVTKTRMEPVKEKQIRKVTKFKEGPVKKKVIKQVPKIVTEVITKDVPRKEMVKKSIQIEVPVKRMKIKKIPRMERQMVKKIVKEKYMRKDTRMEKKMVTKEIMEETTTEKTIAQVIPCFVGRAMNVLTLGDVDLFEQWDSIRESNYIIIGTMVSDFKTNTTKFFNEELLGKPAELSKLLDGLDEVIEKLVNVFFEGDYQIMPSEILFIDKSEKRYLIMFEGNEDRIVGTIAATYVRDLTKWQERKREVLNRRTLRMRTGQLLSSLGHTPFDTSIERIYKDNISKDAVMFKLDKAILKID